MAWNPIQHTNPKTLEKKDWLRSDLLHPVVEILKTGTEEWGSWQFFKTTITTKAGVVKTVGALSSYAPKKGDSVNIEATLRQDKVTKKTVYAFRQYLALDEVLDGELL